MISIVDARKNEERDSTEKKYDFCLATTGRKSPRSQKLIMQDPTRVIWSFKFP